MRQKTIVGAIIVLALIVCGFAVWKLQPNSQKPEVFGLMPIPLLHDGYLVRNDEVYYVIVSPQKNEFEIKDADASTFTPLENGWGKDANHIYFNGSVTRPADASVPTIDIPTFISVPDTFYGKDDKAVYFTTYAINPDNTITYTYEVFPDADGATFEIIEPLRYAKDKSHVWSIRPGEGGPERKLIPGANPAACTADNLAGCEAQ